MRKKYKIILLLLFLAVIVLVTRYIYIKNNGRNTSSAFSKYITGDTNEDPITPPLHFANEEEILQTPKEVWIKLDEKDNNTRGFISDFNCAEMFGEPRKTAGGKDEEICIVIPEENERYFDEVNNFIHDHITRITNPEKKQDITIESDYCGKNEYYEQQRIRIIHKLYEKNSYDVLCVTDEYPIAYRMLKLNNFIVKDDQIWYTGSMDLAEIQKNCDLLMNDYLNDGCVGIYRILKEDSKNYNYFFYSYDVDRGEVNTAMIYIYTYIIDKDNGHVEKNISRVYAQ